MTVSIGTAGWSIPRQDSDRFAADGTALQRYASRFSIAEINSSFHRPHRHSTWERWRDSVPEHFRFSVKLPKTITHERKLVDCAELLTEFLAQVECLGKKLAILLVQLPPRLALDRQVASAFFTALSHRTNAHIACEPRNISWLDEDADQFLQNLNIARVAADPVICDPAALPGGWRGLNYWRLHGSPIIYRSSYSDRIDHYARLIVQYQAADTWCIFDNTASSAGTSDALALMEAV